jgi:hypothetical protein
MTKPTPLSPGLVAIKGSAAPVPDMPTRSPSVAAPAPAPAKAKKQKEEVGTEPLNFRVPAAFRTAFKTYAASHDLKLNVLLKLSFDAYRKQQGD